MYVSSVTGLGVFLIYNNIMPIVFMMKICPNYQLVFFSPEIHKNKFYIIILKQLYIIYRRLWCNSVHGCMRKAPSNRITSPLRSGFSMMLCTRWAYSSGAPSRRGNGMLSPSSFRTGSGRLASSGVSNRPVATGNTRAFEVRCFGQN